MSDDISSRCPQAHLSGNVKEDVLKQQSDRFMKTFDDQEKQRKMEEEANIGVPDEDGFIKGKAPRDALFEILIDCFVLRAMAAGH